MEREREERISIIRFMSALVVLLILLVSTIIITNNIHSIKHYRVINELYDKNDLTVISLDPKINLQVIKEFMNDNLSRPNMDIKTDASGKIVSIKPVKGIEYDIKNQMVERGLFLEGKNKRRDTLDVFERSDEIKTDISQVKKKNDAITALMVASVLVFTNIFLFAERWATKKVEEF